LSNRAPWVKFFFAKPTCAIAPAPAWRDRSRRNAERSRVAGVPRGSEFGMAVQATPTMRYRSSGKIATPSLLLSGGTATDVRPPFRRGHQSGRVPGSGLCRVQGCLRGRQGAAAGWACEGEAFQCAHRGLRTAATKVSEWPRPRPGRDVSMPPTGGGETTAAQRMAAPPEWRGVDLTPARRRRGQRRDRPATARAG
jgi:hypothetical protein